MVLFVVIITHMCVFVCVQACSCVCLCSPVVVCVYAVLCLCVLRERNGTMYGQCATTKKNEISMLFICEGFCVCGFMAECVCINMLPYFECVHFSFFNVFRDGCVSRLLKNSLRNCWISPQPVLSQPSVNHDQLAHDDPSSGCGSRSAL